MTAAVGAAGAPYSQILSRGIQALELLAESTGTLRLPIWLRRSVYIDPLFMLRDFGAEAEWRNRGFA